MQNSSQKVLKSSHLKYEEPVVKNASFDDKMRDKSPRSISNNGNSRVNYLRERLR